MIDSFLLRDRRLQLINTGLSAHPVEEFPQLADLLQMLRQEREELTGRAWYLSDRAYRAIAANWIWGRIDFTLDDFTYDPADLEQYGERPKLSQRMVDDINVLSRPSGGSPLELLGTVSDSISLAGGSEIELDALIYAAHRVFLSTPLENRSYPFDDVGVLLPLRLETLFEETPIGDWILYLRVVPDEPSVLRHSELISKEELAALRAFWHGLDSSHLPDATLPADTWLNSQSGRVAWERLSNRVGARRAAFLVPEFPPNVDGERFVVDVAEELIGEREPDRIGGMPENLDVWMVTSDGAGGEKHDLIETLNPRTDRLKLPIPSDPEAIEKNWLVSWARAVREFDDDREEDGVGMGISIELPTGLTPQDVKTLYVTGIGEDDPATHFSALANAGDLGIAVIGVATNAVQGAPAQDLANDADGWRSIAAERLAGTFLPALAELGMALLGDGSGLTNANGALPALPGMDALGEHGHVHQVEESRRFAHALWPVLWGHALRDHWQWKDDALWLSQWVNDWLCPEGPIDPIRVGDQPYGVIPTTALSQWESLPDDLSEYREVETAFAHHLVRRREHWASVATALPEMGAATTSDLIEFIGRDGLSGGFSQRHFIAPELLAYTYSDPGKMQQMVTDLYQPTVAAMTADLPGVPGPFREYVAIGQERELHLPLIAATRLLPDHTITDLIRVLLGEDGFGDIGLYNYFLEYLQSLLPDSLLIRLMLHSTIVNMAFCAQSADGSYDVLIDKLRWYDDLEETPLRYWRSMYFELQADVNAREPMKQLFDGHRTSLFEIATELDVYLENREDPLDPNQRINILNIPSERLAVLERSMKSALDSAISRIDPWITGVSWRRLSDYSRRSERNYRLGVFGWVDGPFDGQPGPNLAGLIHAPSQPQAITSVILRDKFLSTAAELGDPNAPNPWAMNLDSTHVRQAVELRDDIRLGSHLYEVLGRWVEEIVGTRDGVKQLRALCPLLVEAADQPQVVCNGATALVQLIDPAGGPLAGLSAALSAEQRGQLVHLKESLDTYADLLVSDAVQQVVSGRADLAGEVMDAAAGLSRPPTLEFTRTPPSGFQVASTVLSALPLVPLIDDPSLTPIEIAEPSLAVFVEAAIGGQSEWHWTDIGGNTIATLADLGLHPFEVISLGEEALRLAVEAKTNVPASTMQSPAQFQLMRHLMTVFGNQPATTNDLPGSTVLSAIERTAIDGRIRLSLGDRLTRLRTVCQRDIDALAAATDDVARLRALRHALSWGLIPTSSPSDQMALLKSLLTGVMPDQPEFLAQLATAANATLSQRLTASPSSTEGLSIVQIAQALAELATPDGKISILSSLSTADVTALSDLNLIAGDPELETNWLTTMATVRPSLARLESLQLDASLNGTFTPLAPRSNSVGNPRDPWMKKQIAALQQVRESGSAVKLSTPQFVAAYGPVDSWQSANLAVGLIDTFSEAIPMPQRSTYAAFGFNAPSARAPQAILLSVPPRAKQRLEGEGLFQIVRETRELAHARAVRGEDLGDLQLLASSIWLHGSGLERVRLNSETRWWP